MKNTKSKPNQIVITPEKLSNILNNASTKHSKIQHYPEETKLLALALRASGKTYDCIAQTLGVSIDRAHTWVNDPRLESIATLELTEHVKRTLSNKLYLNASKSLAIADSKAEDASYLQLMTGTGISIDKARLLDGQSTMNVASHYSHIKEISEDEIKLDEKLRKLELEIDELRK